MCNERGLALALQLAIYESQVYKMQTVKEKNESGTTL